MLKEDLWLRGSGPESCTLSRPWEAPWSDFIVKAADHCRISGLTIDVVAVSYGITCKGVSVVLSDCAIASSYPPDTSVCSVLAESSQIVIERCELSGGSMDIVRSDGDCTFLILDSSLTGASRGAGLRLLTYSDGFIWAERSTFRGNWVGMSAYSGIVTAVGCAFVDNWQIGADVESDGPAVFVDCVFERNGQGLRAKDSVEATGCSFRDNDYHVWLEGDGEPDAVTLRDCAFIHAKRSAIFSWYLSYPTLEGCTISGAGTCGLECDEREHVTAVNCVIADVPVGANLDNGSTLDLVSCTVISGGLAVSCSRSSTVLALNSILWSENASAITLDACPDPLITYSDIRSGWLGEGNIDADPGFLSPAAGDFRLGPSSPCIDVANNNVPDLPDTDVAGIHRIMFGGKSLTVDMGAYEFYINDLTPGPNPDQTTFTWSSLADKTYSIFYTDDLLTWTLAVEAFPSSGNQTTSWLDDGSLTGLPPSLAPRRFYRILENP
jgi:hypothetical protein